MSDTLTTITHLINSPPGLLAAGAALAGIVWKFFERVEAVLNEDTKLEIAVWLLGRKTVSPTLQTWPDTFAKMFDRVFSPKHISWKCLYRSSLASYGSMLLVIIARRPYLPKIFFTVTFLLVTVASNVLPDYVSLLESRYVLGQLRKHNFVLALLLGLSIDAVLTSVIAFCGSLLGLLIVAVLSGAKQDVWDVITSVASAGNIRQGFDVLHGEWVGFATEFGATRVRSMSSLFFYPAFFTSIWLWLYAGSGFLLKAARRFDIGFEWFNRHFEIEKKPLQSIGLVAGTLVAVVYWTAVIVSRVL